jgi:hypothetical protein
VFEWFLDWYPTLIVQKAKFVQNPDISEIASKSRYLRVEKKVDEKTGKFQNFANTL